MKSTNLITHLQDTYILVTISANLDYKIAAEALTVFSSLIQHIDRKVRLDLSQSNHMDSSGIGAIAFLHKRLRQLDFELELVGLNTQALTLVQSLGISNVISSRATLNRHSMIFDKPL